MKKKKKAREKTKKQKKLNSKQQQQQKKKTEFHFEGSMLRPYKYIYNEKSLRGKQEFIDPLLNMNTVKKKDLKLN